MKTQLAEAALGKRSQPRNSKEIFVTINLLDEPEDESLMALTKDISDDGMTLVGHIPLPAGTRIEINKDNFSAIAEVCNWEWDYQIDMARMGVRLLEKNGIWPAE